MIVHIYDLATGKIKRWGDVNLSELQDNFDPITELYYLNCPMDATHIINNEPVIVAPPPPDPPTAEELIQEMTRALERYYDSVAQIKRYDNRLTCALRAGYAGVFQQEGITFAIWMDNCNAYGYQVIADVQGGLRVIPTPEELIAELPAAPW